MTDVDLCEAIKKLDVEDLRDIVSTIAIVWFWDGAQLDPNKELGADQIDDVTQILRSYDLFPTTGP